LLSSTDRDVEGFASAVSNRVAFLVVVGLLGAGRFCGGCLVAGAGEAWRFRGTNGGIFDNLCATRREGKVRTQQLSIWREEFVLEA